MNLSRFHTQANTSFQYINPPSLSPLFLLSSFSFVLFINHFALLTNLLWPSGYSIHHLALLTNLFCLPACCSSACSAHHLAPSSALLYPQAFSVYQLCSFMSSFLHSNSNRKLQSENLVSSLYSSRTILFFSFLTGNSILKTCSNPLSLTAKIG